MGQTEQRRRRKLDTDTIQQQVQPHPQWPSHDQYHHSIGRWLVQSDYFKRIRFKYSNSTSQHQYQTHAGYASGDWVHFHST